jgi:transcriptional regulatory protein LevR
MQKRIKDIIQQLSEENGLSFSETLEIVASPWRFMQERLISLDGKNMPESYENMPIFFHQNLGRFRVSEKNFNKVKNKYYAKINKSKNDG